MDSPEGFDAFWLAYPKRKGKLAALRAYAKAIKHSTPAEILRGAQRYAIERRGQDQKFTKHAQGWLNDGRWMDEPEEKPRDLASAFDDLYAAFGAESSGDDSVGNDPSRRH